MPVYLPGSTCDNKSTCEYSADKEGYCIKLVSECPTGTASADPDPLPVDAEIIGVLDDEPQPGLAVVQRCGERVLGCQPVVGRNDHSTELPCQAASLGGLELR